MITAFAPILPPEPTIVAFDLADPGEVAGIARARADAMIVCADAVDGVPTAQQRRLDPATAMMPLDDLMRQLDRRHLHALILGRPERLRALLDGARQLLNHARLDFILLNGREGDIIAAALAHAGCLDLLAGEHVAIGAVDGRLALLEGAPLLDLIARGSDVMLVHKRLIGLMSGQPPAMLDLARLLPEHGVAMRGVIHVGAHLGTEVPGYRSMGARRVLLVEANPLLARGLEERYGRDGDVSIMHCAASDTDGAVTLHVTSMDQASSILPLKDHRALYPQIEEIGEIAVPARRIDRLVDEAGLSPADFNVMNIDIQGAELKALLGAQRVLGAIEAINLEINFTEMYEGCAQIEEIDAHLGARGFVRVALVTPYSASWGDALYIRRGTAAAQGFDAHHVNA